ncbi:hypothetical protein CYJ37_12085 [Bacillus sp. UMB0728]|nr:hypothetical protein CYJ37_12085 [Bacillus sp. UMB0728]
MSVVHSLASFFFLNCLIVPAAINRRTDNRSDPLIAKLINSMIGSTKSTGNPVVANCGVCVFNVAAIDFDVNVRKLAAVVKNILAVLI